MTAKKMWRTFLKIYPAAATQKMDSWCYSGAEADRLAELTAKGVKTATSSAYPVYEKVGESLPRAGLYSVVTRSDGSALCVVYTSRVYVVPFNQVGEKHAWREGEGDRSLAYWRQVHKTHFAAALEQVGLEFCEDMGVVCEEFSRVYPPLS